MGSGGDRFEPFGLAEVNNSVRHPMIRWEEHTAEPELTLTLQFYFVCVEEISSFF